MKKKVILQKIATREFVSGIKKFETKPYQKENVFRPYLQGKEEQQPKEGFSFFTKLPSWD